MTEPTATALDTSPDSALPTGPKLRAHRCRICELELLVERRGVPEGWYRISVGQEDQERSSGVVCSTRCLRTLVDRVAAAPTEEPARQPKPFYCQKCRREQTSLFWPENWLSVWRAAGDGRVIPVGLFCTPGCLNERLTGLAATIRKARKSPRGPSAARPARPTTAPIPVHLAQHTCAVCFETFPLSASQCPRGHRNRTPVNIKP